MTLIKYRVLACIGSELRCSTLLWISKLTSVNYIEGQKNCTKLEASGLIAIKKNQLINHSINLPASLEKVRRLCLRPQVTLGKPITLFDFTFKYFYPPPPQTPSFFSFPLPATNKLQWNANLVAIIHGNGQSFIMRRPGMKCTIKMRLINN